MIKKPELLAPAGNLEKLKVAIRYGADAVYLGGSKLNLRAFAHNFDNDQLREGVKYAHDRGKKVYVTLNVIPHNGDFAGIEDYLRDLYEIGVDAIIVADPGIIATAKEVVPDLELHLSTQANAVNIRTVKFWHSMGIKRVVPAREMSMQEIKDLMSGEGVLEQAMMSGSGPTVFRLFGCKEDGEPLKEKMQKINKETFLIRTSLGGY